MTDCEMNAIGKYDKINLNVSRFLANSFDGPEQLGGYIGICRHGFGVDRKFTNAGAKKIRLTVGCTEYRSKQVHSDLLSVCEGPDGNGPPLVFAKKVTKCVSRYEISNWGGEFAYVPTLFVDECLPRLCKTRDRAIVRDALLMLLYIYANVDYGGWMGVPVSKFAYQNWHSEGERVAGYDDFQLGRVADWGDSVIYFVAAPDSDNWMVPGDVPFQIFGGSAEEADKRFWAAFDFLLSNGAICRVAMVSRVRRSYPLWIFNPKLRQGLNEQFSIIGSLGRNFNNLACRRGLDPDNRLMIAAMDADRERDGTGLYYCAGGNPLNLYTVITPTFYATTPRNCDGLKEIGEVTQELCIDLDRA